MVTHMEFEEKHNWHGHIIITVMRDGKVTERYEFENMIMDAGRNLLRDALIDGTISPKIRYLAYGTGTTPPSREQTQLVAETARCQVTKQITYGIGSCKTTVIIPSGISAQINEIGWFAASGIYSDPSGPNQGTMIARVLWSHNKSALESVTIDRVDVFA